MKKSPILIVICAVAFLILIPKPVLADGIIIPEPPPCDPCPFPSPMSQLEIRSHSVDVTIENQIATTRVDQVFYNPNDWAVEGDYVFPIPLDAAVSDFLLWVDGEPVHGDVLDSERARQIYEDIVISLQDPALLEFTDRGAVKASIFPIPPLGERRIELEYSQALGADRGLVRYAYPLSTEKFSLTPLEEVRISVEIRSDEPLRAVYSPSHPIEVVREGDYSARAEYIDHRILPDRDFSLYYSIGEAEAFHLLTLKEPGEAADPDGYFMLLIAPGIRQRVEAVQKDVIVVLDRSGSMDGEKFVQAQEALRYVLKNLNPGDRFNLITFSDSVNIFSRELRDGVEVEEALAWVNGLHAEGSTDINRALLEAAFMATDESEERPAYLIFLTDGLPTEGVTDSQVILDNFAEAAPPNLSLFAFGVGYDVDTFVLDSLAQTHHGSSTYVLPGERLDEVLSTFYARIGTPVLTDLSLDFGNISVYDLYPGPLPDLFLGSQIVLLGRYRDGGPANVTLSGKVGGIIQTFEYPEQLFVRDSREGESSLNAIQRLWATRKIGHLLNQIRLHGPNEETIDQIVRLSIRYGIVTPYTSYLVTEPLPLGEAEQERIASEEFNALQEQPSAPTSGQAAVEKAAGQGALADADALILPSVDVMTTVRAVGSRTFIFREGVWTDTAFDPENFATRKVVFLSEDYFQLIRSNPDLAAAFALGPEVIAISGGVAYEVREGNDNVSDPVVTPGSDTEVSPEPTQIAPEHTEDLESESGSSASCLSGLLAPAPLLMLGAVWLKTRTGRNRDHSGVGVS